MTTTDVLTSITDPKAICSLVPPGQCQFTPAFKPVKLLQRTQVNHNTCALRFAVPDESKPLNLSTCACILSKATIDGEDVIRPYTPISTNAQIGSFDLLVKQYPDGKMSQHMKSMPIGDTLEFKHIEFNVKIQAPFKAKKIGMIVGGTGITPMVQALHAILGNEEDKETKVVMLYGSRTSDDILGVEMLDAWEKKYPDQLEVVHVLSGESDVPDSKWKGKTGFITKEIIQEKFAGPENKEDVMIFVCGPPPMYNVFCGPRDSAELTGVLKDVGYDESQVFKF